MLYLYGLDGDLLARLWGQLMEINNWVDMVLYTFMTVGVVFIAFPTGIRCIYVGCVALFKHRVIKFDNRSRLTIYSRTSIEMILAGVLCVAASIWFLFFDKGGHLFHYPAEVMRFFAGT